MHKRQRQVRWGQRKGHASFVGTKKAAPCIRPAKQLNPTQLVYCQKVKKWRARDWEQMARRLTQKEQQQIGLHNSEEKSRKAGEKQQQRSARLTWYSSVHELLETAVWVEREEVQLERSWLRSADSSVCRCDILWWIQLHSAWMWRLKVCVADSVGALFCNSALTALVSCDVFKVNRAYVVQPNIHRLVCSVRRYTLL